MRLLLDTHTFLWWHGERAKLSPKVLSLCEDVSNDLLLSVASVWEIQIKTQLGKLTLQNPLQAIVAREQRENAIAILPVGLAHVYALDNLPTYHRDPFDRILIAQAQTEGLSLLTNDRLITQYSVSTTW